MEEYKKLVQQKYIDFFSNPESVYMFKDGIHQPHYIGVAMEFVSTISSSRLPVDYDDLYNNVFKDQKWLYIDTLAELTDEFISNLSALQITTIFAAIRHKELFCTGFIERCGQAGVISRLLLQLKILYEKR